jgi:hypothetical protein
VFDASGLLGPQTLAAAQTAPGAFIGLTASEPIVRINLADVPGND